MRLKIPGLMIAVTSTLLAGTTPATAQWRTEPILPTSRAPSAAMDPPELRLPDSLQLRPPHDVTLALAGVVGAAFGGAAGAYWGNKLDGDNAPGWRMAGGWVLGSGLTTPLSVHLANGGRGTLPLAYVSSALIAGAGMAGSRALGNPERGLVLLVTPLAHVISAVLIERRGAR